MKTRHTIASAFLMVILTAAGSFGADEKLVVKWSGTDIDGKAVSVPVDRPSVVAFVRADQDQSKAALKQILAATPDAKAVQVVVILSGPSATELAKQLKADISKDWPIAADPDFAATGKMNIHVWPTTLVIKPDGTQVAHLAGMPKSFTTELAAYLEYANGKLDENALKTRLATQDVVTDSPTQAASRHLQVAQRLLEQGQTEQAQSELSAGLKIAPNDPLLQLTLARVQAMLNHPKEALELLDKVPASAAPGWQMSQIRGRALILQDKWADAKAILPEALKLNPDPAEAHYLLGLCFQHDQDPKNAAEQFRLAFEKTAGGSKTAVPAAAR